MSLTLLLAASFDHVVALLEAERHRLFDEDMLAGVAGVDGEAVVQLMAQYYGHGFDLVVLQKLGVRRVALGDVVLLHIFTALLFEEIGDRDDLDVVEGVNGTTVGAGDAAQADDSYFQFRHVCLSCSCVL
jgi:hypothetical protein